MMNPMGMKVTKSPLNRNICLSNLDPFPTIPPSRGETLKNMKPPSPVLLFAVQTCFCFRLSDSSKHFSSELWSNLAKKIKNQDDIHATYPVGLTFPAMPLCLAYLQSCTCIPYSFPKCWQALAQAQNPTIPTRMH